MWLHPFLITRIFSMDNLTAAVSMNISYLETLLNSCRMNQNTKWEQIGSKMLWKSSLKIGGCYSSMLMPLVLVWDVQQSHVCQVFIYFWHVYIINIFGARISLQRAFKTLSGSDDASPWRGLNTQMSSTVLYKLGFTLETACRHSVFVDMNIRQFWLNPTCAPAKLDLPMQFPLVSSK